MPTRCFLLQPTDVVRLHLRRYTDQHTGNSWTCAAGWHEAMTFLADTPAVWEERADNSGWTHKVVTHAVGRPLAEDPRWPATCAKCDYRFLETDTRQLFYDLLYRPADTAETTTLRDAPAGAMWNSWWLQNLKPGGYLGGPSPDGQVLMVKCPNGREWCIDGRASNCTLPEDDVHKCWVRHGTPPDLVVDKNGTTCSAGAGSIQSGDYHGFLGSSGAAPGWFT